MITSITVFGEIGGIDSLHMYVRCSGTVMATTLLSSFPTNSLIFLQSGFRYSGGLMPATLCLVHMILIKVRSIINCDFNFTSYLRLYGFCGSVLYFELSDILYCIKCKLCGLNYSLSWSKSAKINVTATELFLALALLRTRLRKRSDVTKT